MNNKKVAIIGAGPAGLSAGLALHKAGIEATIYERSDEITPLGGAIILNAVVLNVLRREGVDIEDMYNGVRAEFRRYDYKERAIINVDKDLLNEANASGWQSGMMRKELYARMLQAMPEGMIVPSKEYSHFSEDDDGITIYFADGSSEHADVLVGADGLRSKIRYQLYPGSPQPKELGIAVWLGWCEAGDIEFDEACPILHDQNYQIGFCPLVFEGKKCFEWWMVEEYTGQEKPDDVSAYIKSKVGHFANPVRDILANTDHNKQLFRWIVEYIPRMKQWSKGRVTLMGDAAHPTSPYAAYGAGMAIEDGYFLAKFLKDSGMKDKDAIIGALKAYDDKRRPYTNQTTYFARNMGRVYHNIPKPFRKIRDFMLDNVAAVGKGIEKGVTEEASGLLRELLDNPF
jgi:2-polyprenyl-6-methoxyphenol hydroxylase-like FAD-dependent oxidoreductase